MEKELVKVGMKVKFAQDTFLGLKEQTPLLENEFTIVEVKDDGCVLSATIKGNTCNLQNVFNCADFEPYEEPNADNGTYSTSDPLEIAWLKRMCAENKEEREEAESNLKELLNLPKEDVAKLKVDKFLNGNTNKGFVINLDALEQFGTNLETGEKITPKEILDKFLSMPTILVRSEDNLPITQEFIESFGFAKIREKRTCFSKDIGKNEAIFLLWKGEGTFSLYQISRSPMGENSEPIFQDFTCTTQSELRFLLTKGRIDCSK